MISERVPLHQSSVIDTQASYRDFIVASLEATFLFKKNSSNKICFSVPEINK